MRSLICTFGLGGRGDVFLMYLSRNLTPPWFKGPVLLCFALIDIGFIGSLFLANARALTSSSLDGVIGEVVVVLVTDIGEVVVVLATDITGVLIGLLTEGRFVYCSDSNDVTDRAGEPANLRCTDGGFFKVTCSVLGLSFSGHNVMVLSPLMMACLLVLTGNSWGPCGLSLGEGLGESLAPSGP